MLIRTYHPISPTFHTPDSINLVRGNQGTHVRPVSATGKGVIGKAALNSRAMGSEIEYDTRQMSIGRCQVDSLSIGL